MAEQASHLRNDGTVAQPDLDNLLDQQDTASAATMDATLPSAATTDATLPSAGGGDFIDSEDLISFEDEDKHTPVDSSTQLNVPVLTHEPTNVHVPGLLDMSTLGQELAVVEESTQDQATNVEVKDQDEEMWKGVSKKLRKSRQDTGMSKLSSGSLDFDSKN